jgi:hypothetical protein
LRSDPNIMAGWAHCDNISTSRTEDEVRKNQNTKNFQHNINDFKIKWPTWKAWSYIRQHWTYKRTPSLQAPDENHRPEDPEQRI